MRKQARLLHYLLALFFTALFTFSVCEYLFRINPVRNFFYPELPMKRIEEYDSRLHYLNSVSKLESYTDSIAAKTEGNGLSEKALYPVVLCEVVKKRFYDGLHTYTIGNNFLAYLATKISGRSWNEVWNTNDILKSGNAFCGQQSLVMMDILIKKGYQVRAVKMFSKTYNAGHYAFEAYYEGKWHYYDPNMEASTSFLSQRGYPSFTELTTDKNTATGLYPLVSPLMVSELFSEYKFGGINELMPGYMYLFQSITKILSSVSWLICIIMYFLVLRKYSYSFSKLHLPRKTYPQSATA